MIIKESLLQFSKMHCLSYIVVISAIFGLSAAKASLKHNDPTV